MESINYLMNPHELWNNLKKIPTTSIRQIYPNMQEFALKNPIVTLATTIALLHIAAIASSFIALGLAVLVGSTIITQGRSFIYAAGNKLTSGEIIDNSDIKSFRTGSILEDLRNFKEKVGSILSYIDVFSLFSKKNIDTTLEKTQIAVTASDEPLDPEYQKKTSIDKEE